MTRRASVTFRLAATALTKENPEPLFDRLRTAFESFAVIATGDEYRADRAEQETLTNVPVAYAPLVTALLPVADLLAPPEYDLPF